MTASNEEADNRNGTQDRSLVIYFSILIALSGSFVLAARAMSQQAAFLAQGYMLTPALAALLTRLFFYKKRFKDANLRLGRLQDYARFWMASLGITALSYVFFSLLGAISWDFTGQSFLDRLALQFGMAGQDITDTLPSGFTPQMMLLIFFVGGLTIFNILPGLITGFGEEFGHRGFMFPALYRLHPAVGIVGGGLIWYAWHWPVALLAPASVQYTFPQALANFLILGLGSLCTFIYLAYVYIKSRSIWVASLAHIVLNNSSASFSYFAVMQDQLLANLGLMLTMVTVVLILLWSKELSAFSDYFA